ncbi:hypothetical protein B0J14DRAFT_689460 [Halenospora varia]|nr:hypothetical protein B0J14DRAFT_689460 [Halenospora varia]
MLAGFAVPGAILGYDFAGTVIEMGSDVSKGYKNIQIGDRVLGTGNSMDRAYTNNALAYALDCITVAPTMKLCYEAIGRAGGRYTALDPFPEAQHTRRVIKPDWILGSVSKGHGSTWPAPYGRGPEPEALDFAEELLKQAQKDLDSGEIRNHPARVRPGGLTGVLDGIEIIRRNEVSGFKLVYLVDDV